MTDGNVRDEASFARRFETALAAIQDVSLRWHIVDVFLALHRLDGRDQRTVVVLAARRMACLYAVAYQCGFRPADDVEIVSDRLSRLQDPDKWQGSRVILLDDVFDTGRTYQTRWSTLKQISAGHPLGSVIFLTEAAEWSDDEDVPLPPPMRISAGDAGTFSTQLSLALAEAMIPLITDYPISHLGHVSREELSIALEHPEWRSFEVTNSLSAGKGVRAFTFLPSFDSSDSGIPSELTEVCKLRLFLRSEGSGYEARLVPIVGFRPLRSGAASRYFAALGWEDMASADAGERIALMNYAASLHFFHWMADRPEIRILECITADCAKPWDRLLTRHYLGRKVDLLLHRYEVGTKTLASLAGLIPVAEEPVSTSGSNSLARFSSLIDDRWLHCVVGDDLVEGVHQILKRHADSPRSLAAISKHLSTRSDVASLAIDILNDHGSAVPSSRTENGIDYWCFAAGELTDPPDAGEFGGVWASIPRTLVFDRESTSPLAFTR